MKRQTIITPDEVNKYSPATENFSKDALCVHIARVEVECFKKCYLGLDFYEKLKADLNVTEVPEEYVATTTYAIGDLVCYDGCFYQSKIDDNNVNPDDVDSVNPEWCEPDKFKNDCYNDLWELYLCQILAFKVLYATVRYQSTKATNKGVVKTDSEHTKSATMAELQMYKKALRDDVQEMLEQMFDYMVVETKHGACDFSSVEKVGVACGCEAECIEPKKRKRRRILFR